MAQLTAVATVLASDTERENSVVALNLALPAGPLSLASLSHLLGNRVTPSQLDQIQFGTSALRRAFSSQVLTHFVLRRVKADMLSRTDVGSDEAWARIHDGGALISLGTDPGFRGLGQTGRPFATSIDDAFKNALGEAVARVMVLGVLAEGDEYSIFERGYAEMGRWLETRAALFNLNHAHQVHHAASVLNWCETNGPGFLAAAYGMAPDALERALEAAFKMRLKTRGFATVLDAELGRIATLLGWITAHLERKKGTASRRDTTRRALEDKGLDWDSVPGRMDPPSMSGKVRRNVIAQKAMTALTPMAMIEAAFLFDLEPAYGVFLTRLYLLPILASAGLAGRVGLRGLKGEIASPVLAGGLLALVEAMGAETVEAKTMSGTPDASEDDEIGQLQARVRDVLTHCGLSASALAVKGYGYLEIEQALDIDPPGGPKRFFLED